MSYQETLDLLLPSVQTLSLDLQASIGVPSMARSTRPIFSLEWAAGFADGEGCISIVKERIATRRSVGYRLVFCMVQNDLEVLEYFNQGLGGMGKIYKVKRRMGHNRQIYTLNYSGSAALELIRTLQPCLVRKQLEAQAALDFWRDGRCGQRPQGARSWPPEVIAIRERYFQKLRALK